MVWNDSDIAIYHEERTHKKIKYEVGFVEKRVDIHIESSVVCTYAEFIKHVLPKLLRPTRPSAIGNSSAGSN